MVRMAARCYSEAAAAKLVCVNANIRERLPKRLYSLTVELASRSGTSFLALVEKTGLSPTQVKTAARARAAARSALGR